MRHSFRIIRTNNTVNNSKLYQDFKSAFDQYYNSLCNYAYSFIKDREASEDIVQELFINVWEKRKDLIAADGLRYYLFTAIRNNCLSYLAKQKKSVIEPLTDLHAVEEMPTGSEDSPDRNYKAILAASIAQLPPKCKEVFLLSRLSKLSYREIADIHQISIKTVENQIGKALKILRALAKKEKLVAFAIYFTCFIV